MLFMVKTNLSDTNTKPKVKRIGGYLHRIIPIVDGTGKIVNHIAKPFMVELRPRDIMQIVVGATILAIPVGFTEEVWFLSEKLPMLNIILLALLSIMFIASFVYFNFYRGVLNQYLPEYIKRTFAVYLLSLLVVGIFLSIIQIYLITISFIRL